VGAGQASALYQAYQNDRGLGDLERSLKESGVDVSKLNSKQIAAVAEVAGTDRTGVWKQAERLQSLEGADKLNLADARTLRDAMAGGDESELRKVVVRLTAAYDSTRDQGEQMRQTQANMANSMQELATKLIPATLAIKDGIVELVRWFAGDSDYVRKHDAEKAAEAEQAKKDAALQRAIADKQAAIDNWKPDEAAAQRAATSYGQLKRQRDEAAAAGRDTSGFDHNLRLLEAEIRRNSPEGLSDLTAERDALMRRREAGPAERLGAGPVSHGSHSLTPEQRAQLRENDRELGLPPGTLEAQMRVESGFNPNAVSKAGARGYAQLMPKTQAALEKRWGRKIDPSNFDDAARAQKELMAENLRKFGNAQDAMRAYNGGWDPDRWGNPETSAYAGKIERAREEIAAADDRKTPESVRTASASDFGPQQVSLNVGGRFELYDQQGRELAQPIIQTFFGAPRPAGMFS
jgi:soluble lytic murein transglycosylase-like protein